MTELLLVRHARPDSGIVDPPLSAEGREQARRLGDALAGAGLTAVVSSDMRRARETATAATAATGLELQVVPALREWGRVAGEPVYTAIEELGATSPQAVALAEGRFMDFIPEDVDLDDFRATVVRGFGEVFAAHPSGRIAVVCHGGTINAYLGHVLGIRDIFWFHPGYTSISTVALVPGGRVVVRAVNDVHHLAESAAIPA